MPVRHGNKHYLQDFMDNAKYQDLEQCAQEQGVMTIAPVTARKGDSGGPVRRLGRVGG